MASEMEYLSISSLVLSIFAASISLVRFQKESRIQRQADTVTAFYDIVRLIDNDRAVESRGILRANPDLNRLKNVGPTDQITLPDLDEKTVDAARFVATTYDRLGFILKHDPRLEQDVLAWNGDVIADMWLMTRPLIKKKWRARNPRYAIEFERLAEKALADAS